MRDSTPIHIGRTGQRCAGTQNSDYDCAFPHSHLGLLTPLIGSILSPDIAILTLESMSSSVETGVYFLPSTYA